MKRFLYTLFVTFVLFTIPVIVSAADIIIDGDMLICRDSSGNTVEPFVENGTTYVPVRAIAEAFDTAVSWDQETKTVFLGERAGTPQLNESINIMHNGEEFMCYDVNKNRVYPILREGTTYLPIRGIGELFGKKVFWDNIGQRAVLITPPTSDATAYLVNAIANTQAVSGLTQELTFSGKIYLDKLIGEISKSETTTYSPSSFALSPILPEGYAESVSYLGEGKYFIFTSSELFTAASYMRKALLTYSADAEYSPLYITVSTQKGYVTGISIDFSARLTHNTLVYRQELSIGSVPVYPEDFHFPNIPYPDADENGSSIFSEDARDAEAISDFVEEYIGYAVKAASTDIVNMLYKEDYTTLFYSKSSNQQKTQYNTIAKNLGSIFKHATGEYEIVQMKYIDAASLPYSPQKAARIDVELVYKDKSEAWTEEIELLLIKIDGSWYLSASMVRNLY